MKELFSLDFSYKPDDEELSSIVNSVNEFAEKISPMFFSTEAFKICINFQDTTWTLIKESPFVEMLSNLEEDESSDDEDFPDADMWNCPIRISAAAGNPTRPIWTSCLSPFKAVCLKS